MNELSKINILSEDDMKTISTFLWKTFPNLDYENMQIRLGLSAYDLESLDRKLFFQFHPEAVHSDFVHGEEVPVTVGDVNFLFLNKE